MTFDEFVKLADKPAGMAVGHYAIANVPLSFGSSTEVLVKQLDWWGSLDDFRDVLEIGSFEKELGAKYPQYQAFADADVGLLEERNPDFHRDSYVEFVLFVDTSKDAHPVFVLGSERSFDDGPIFESFAAFYEALTPT